jgi:hypothetical protein
MAQPDKTDTDCQANTFESGSESMPRIVDLARRGREQLRRYGVKATLGKVLGFLADRLTAESEPSMSGPTPFAAAATDEVTVNVRRPEDVLKLQPGEYIEVKSEAEILQTLDEQGRLNGLAYVPSMKEFCGRRFKVFKRMETMYQEESGKVRRLKNTVLLDQAHCDGLLMRCDRACFFYWREEWLRRADGPKSELIQIK